MWVAKGSVKLIIALCIQWTRATALSAPPFAMALDAADAGSDEGHSQRREGEIQRRDLGRQLRVRHPAVECIAVGPDLREPQKPCSCRRMLVDAFF